ncbi:MAG: hypothetical protein MRY64_04055 [Hyphomonadaceae bacterium]|nr:hypothetical protein [Hyphomonadaceae bacterium]
MTIMLDNDRIEAMLAQIAEREGISIERALEKALGSFLFEMNADLKDLPYDDFLSAFWKSVGVARPKPSQSLPKSFYDDLDPVE